ncbi:RASSF2_4 [Mytilus edulis]|uniref:RASSF2_4 n=1 Tax=Mytilus edulis TaxID=6550 RepID=A0A8S3QP46_MYTED|nr:RASSF2_4 [Mytilus edulis]
MMDRIDIPDESILDVEKQEVLNRIKTYNEYYQEKGKKRQSVSASTDNNNLVIRGPVTILWGVKKPIRFQHCDDVPPERPTVNHRHSFMPGSEVKIPSDMKAIRESTSSPLRKITIDDIAYRGDKRPEKWKRASINGHIYSYETCVFTPSLGSSTSVTVDSTATTPEVIKALLDKFKVENSPNEYALYIVDEENSERILRDKDCPLLERINLGPDEVSGAKLLLRDRVERKQSLLDTPIFEVSPAEEEVSKGQEDFVKLPDEIETLIALPEPVLRGILSKFKQDEDDDVHQLKSRFELAKRRLKEEMKKLSEKT